MRRTFIAAVLFISFWGLMLPLRDILAYPARVSVLPSLQVDAATYDEIGRAVASSGIDAVPVRQPPGFVVVLGALYRTWGASYTTARLFLWLSLIAATVLAAWLAGQVWSRGAALVAAVLTATAPAFRHYVGTVQYEVWTACLLLVVVSVATKAVGAMKPRTALLLAAAAGLAAALLCLTREVFLGILPLIAAWLTLLQRRRHGWRIAIGGLTLFVTLAAAPIGIWSALQSQKHGSLIVITDKGPVTFLLGNNPAASGTYNVDRVVEPAGTAYLVQRPGEAAQLWGRKALYFWGVLRDGWNVPRPAALWVHRGTGGLVPFDAVLPLARGGWLLVGFVIGLVALGASGQLWRWWLLPAVVVAIMTAHVVTLSSHRFAVPVLPLVFIMIAGPMHRALVAGVEHLRGRRVLQATVIALITSFVALQWSAPRVAVTYRAADLDAMNEVNAYDESSGGVIRHAAADRGPRAVMILADEYSPAGEVRVHLRLRAAPANLAPDTPVARATLMELDGAVACAEDVPYGSINSDQLTDAWIFCRLKTEGPVTLVVETTGATDLDLSSVELAWPRSA